MRIKLLFVIHGFITMSAGLVLFLSPASIPAAAGITITKDQFLICYLLSAIELGIAALSFGAVYIKDNTAIRVICLGMIVMHICSAIFELVAWHEGANSSIGWNVLLRIIVAVLFYFLGIRKQKLPEAKLIAERD